MLSELSKNTFFIIQFLCVSKLFLFRECRNKFETSMHLLKTKQQYSDYFVRSMLLQVKVNVRESNR